MEAARQGRRPAFAPPRFRPLSVTPAGNGHIRAIPAPWHAAAAQPRSTRDIVAATSPWVRILQDRAEQPAAAHQHLPGALGTTEVQAAQDIQEGPAMVGRADRKAAAHVRPPGLDDRIPEQPVDETSGVKGDFHAPLYVQDVLMLSPRPADPAPALWPPSLSASYASPATPKSPLPYTRSNTTPPAPRYPRPEEPLMTSTKDFAGHPVIANGLVRGALPAFRPAEDTCDDFTRCPNRQRVSSQVVSGRGSACTYQGQGTFVVSMCARR